VLLSLRDSYSRSAVSHSIMMPDVVRSEVYLQKRGATRGSLMKPSCGCGGRVVTETREGKIVTVWYIVCGVIALLLLAYLFVAMLKPESFQ